MSLPPFRPGGPEPDLDPRFTPVRLRQGYDPREVDDLVARVVTVLRRGAPNGLRPTTTRLTTTRWREGYRIAEVDAWLAATERWIVQLDAGR